MVDVSAKGSRNEKKCADYFLSSGYAVQKVIRSKWNKKDFFNLFDVITKCPNRTYFIQVKTNQLPSKKLKSDIEEFSIKYGASYDIFQVWCWFDRKGFRRFVLNLSSVVKNKYYWEWEELPTLLAIDFKAEKKPTNAITVKDIKKALKLIKETGGEKVLRLGL